MGKIVIVAYKPKPGCEEQLLAHIKTHVPRLREEGLVTDREAIISHSEDGTIVEIFEWKNAAAIQKAHTDERVQKMWDEFGELSNYEPLKELPESHDVFAVFTAIE